MKIGFFDSGLGGLYLLRSMLRSKLSKYDFVFLGDTKNLPYGEKSQEEIYELTRNAVEFLFNQGCGLVIVACNTSSAQALRKIQQKFLKSSYPDKKVLGVIRPTVELIKAGNVCVLATSSTVNAKAYTKELKNINPKLKITEIAAPELVPLIESGHLDKLSIKVKEYADLVREKKVKNLILGCTHYAIVRDEFAQHLKGIKIISQESIVPVKLQDYLDNHPEIERNLSQRNERKFFVTKLNPTFHKSAKLWFGKKLVLTLAKV
ncbi:MAG: glutamate racemase [Candidatus Doudnabacteria bacterium RIFCSPLOWO2_02_FULL_42_9]|uniref:Glutamate racemase n=1 Tax=Candidatus Doudnabacteria bacterium RIFCSPHIGHO2_01_FULL_41_86 TaxID=1817821 RepID=A0A1F5N892_9BACT|nr:MAG: glutamate racemase [Candidatus Doudnabacteria bacterium RIFCSPHIGHO2_01_FULL_41_86]OGE75885.1 MAG: glutamate racemase [Candidatus Doudnabacteria bacterium RIFCSPHIGHO2_01_43_10]OGE86259.1 MAG: glutamate racemase [Candidatus Doudnabacteria bacterium RIFCSPHIGHO2_12_FULL_42_22]OGE87107.1 MAG: glutamate racemase [Candidatus Doudnabacteria bacterium RIFCSPHIGHO2_02_FULL_42_25]OGE92247.1 MAG: glutamate racemase [Candidatus Doudnabacteria bacterium RIFCSPLOWO2_01_FULL_42_60]OGE94304.1 MAG: g